jgi:hypothetical protein
MRSWLNNIHNAPTPQLGRASSSQKPPASANKAKVMPMFRAFGLLNKSVHGNQSPKPFIRRVEKL